MTKNYHSKIILLILTGSLIFARCVSFSQDYPVYKWNEQSNLWVQDATIKGNRIAVAPDGTPWVLSSGGQIFHLLDSKWTNIEGTAKDIGIGSNGIIWIVAGSPTDLLIDGPVYERRKETWVQVQGQGVNISVDGKGIPWIINAAGSIFRWENRGGKIKKVAMQFTKLPGLATDIGIGGNPSQIWITGQGGEVYHLTDSLIWNRVSGNGYRIAVGIDGEPWIINLQREIYRRINGKFEKMPDRANDIAIGADGSVWIIGYSSSSPKGQNSTSMKDSHSSKINNFGNIDPKLFHHKTFVPIDQPVPGSHPEDLVVRGSAAPVNHNWIFIENGSTDGFKQVTINLYFESAAYGTSAMNGGKARWMNRRHDVTDLDHLTEQLKKQDASDLEWGLKGSNGCYQFTVQKYKTPNGELYYKVLNFSLLQKCQGDKSVRID